MMTRGLFIEIIDVNKLHGYVEKFSGTLRVDGIGRVQFEVFRNPANVSYLQLRVYNSDMNVIIPEFSNQFFSTDYDNRKIIMWIGEHAEELVEIRPSG